MKQPKPYKIRCPKCGATKIITIRDLTIDKYILHHCDKCSAKMEKCDFDFFDKMLGKDSKDFI